MDSDLVGEPAVAETEPDSAEEKPMTAKTRAESPPRLETVLKDLAERRIALDKLDDKLSALIQRIESVLRMQVSTRISCLIRRNDQRVDFLAFGKHDGRFMLLVESGDMRRSNEVIVDSTTPLLSSSREMRTLVFSEGIVEKLIRTAHEQLSEQIVARGKALAAAEELMVALGSFSVAEDSTTPDSSSDDDLPF